MKSAVAGLLRLRSPMPCVKKVPPNFRNICHASLHRFYHASAAPPSACANQLWEPNLRHRSHMCPGNILPALRLLHLQQQPPFMEEIPASPSPRLPNFPRPHLIRQKRDPWWWHQPRARPNGNQDSNDDGFPTIVIWPDTKIELAWFSALPCRRRCKHNHI